ncbi:unnamed protein product [Periconia digitata]|uniref:Flavin-containing monooxygenase n=1 Tax=Periconia digitata TaxID=1303443 RepID=A0A9W4UK37_9PLEO|nr:unnamed protein product [Periconia digitata]
MLHARTRVVRGRVIYKAGARSEWKARTSSFYLLHSKYHSIMNSNPIHTERHMRIICVGAGASGLCFAYKLQRSFANFTLTMYDTSPDVGGVWYQNKYPGCECDYEAHNYTYSWEPKADWPQVYASADQIQGYFADFARKYDLYPYCKFNHRVVAADWKEEQGSWQVLVQDETGTTTSTECDILVNATGILSTPKWPDIPQLEKFGGAKMHSGAWDTSLDLTGKKVCLIGNGSSGQQILRAIQPIVSDLTVMIRQPTWVFGPFGEPQRDYTAEELQNFKDHPEVLTAKRKRFESRVNSYFGFCQKDSPQQSQIRDHLTKAIREKLGELGSTKVDESAVIPKYGVGCRRPTPGIGYIEAITASNVSLVVGRAREATEKGIVDDKGILHEVDVLICATGFDTSHRPPFTLRGSGGKDLATAWRERSTAYLALAVPDMPNYLVFYGPNNPFGSGPFLATVEAQADYMLKVCDRWQTENVHAFSPKPEVVQELQQHLDSLIAKTVWADSCNSWYKPEGQNVPANLWPGSGLHYMETISAVRWEDYDVRYKGNRYAWLGNGFSQIETDPECDLAFYIGNEDDSEMIGKRTRRRKAAGGNMVDPDSLHVFGPKD